jgi:hypothetical protein
MSFEENDQSFIWTCNGCGHVAEFPPLDFWRALSELKARGWKIERDREEGDWIHYCRRCRPKAATNIAEFLNRKPERRSA